MTASTFDFAGVWTAIVTPFVEGGEIDWPAFETLLERQAAAGIKGVVIAGTTGESPALSVQEKLSLTRKARALLPPEVKIMAGTGGNNTGQSVELSKLAEDAGADCLLVVTPPYNKPSPLGLQRHFTAIADAVKIPMCLYHVPARTGQMLSVKVISDLCEIDRIGSVKEASADLGFFSRALGASKSTQYLSGDDPTFLPSLSVGGSGVISVVTNVFPKIMVEIYDAFQNRDNARARELHDQVLPVIDALFCEANPGPTKAALAILGLAQNIVRAPLAEVTQDHYTFLQEVIKASGLKND